MPFGSLLSKMRLTMDSYLQLSSVSILISTKSILIFTKMKYTEVHYKCGLCTYYVENYLNLFYVCRMSV